MESIEKPIPPSLVRLVEPLLQWYNTEGRVLPWREKKDPYCIWVSEIMLQQTRIETVKPYFARFLSALPDVQALAMAPEDKLLKLWQGLGYYSRVRNMQKAARQIMAGGGEFPHTAQELLKLPGIGEYTAGAIASIAFGEKAPAVDGNVLRVLSRYLNSPEDIQKPAVRQQFSSWLRQIYPDGQEGAFTQALMELGEVVCLPGAALQCDGCPLRENCEGARCQTAAALPNRAPKKPQRLQPRTVLVLRCGEKAALRRRPEKGLLAGLWELPGVDGHCTKEEVRVLLSRWGLSPVSVEDAGEFTHGFSHIRWQMKGYLCRVEREEGEGLLWADDKALRDKWALPSAFSGFFPLLPGSEEREKTEKSRGKAE